MGYFQDNYENVQYVKGNENKNGLRNAQIGAIHAISSFFTIERDKAAMVVMPTGSGKTAVLMMTPFVTEAEKVLVVTPSKMVRGQIVDDFSELRTLTGVGVLPVLLHKPNVYEMEHGYDSEREVFYNSQDVIVATPQCAGSLLENMGNIFDCVLIDEAHHVPATTWTKILDQTKESKQVLFTATPFRLDEREIKAEIVYRYPLHLAYRDGIFGEIMYIPIEEGDEKDIKIALKAEEIFNNDRENGFDHCLMIRAATQERGKELEQVYKTNTKLRLRRIDSSTSNAVVKQCIGLLKSKGLDGIICVNMLGEGFDFPNLKIAAIHDAHKSLANTLQFIGRFARTNASSIGTAKFIAMNDEELLIENKKLYSSDAVWQDMIIDISDGVAEKVELNKEYIGNYQKQEISKYSEYDISLYDVRPGCHAKIYKVMEFDVDAKFPELCCVVGTPYINKMDSTVVAIGRRTFAPKWLSTKQIEDVENLLFIVHYQKKTGLLFILSQIKTEAVYEEIAKAFCGDFEKLSKEKMHRVLANLKEFEIFNSGMVNRYAEAGESYRISAGADTSRAIDESTGRMYSAGHAFCKAVNEKSSEITIGYSSASKMWSSAYLPLGEYIQWCEYNGEKIINNTLQVKTNTNFDLLPIPKALEKYPDNLFYVGFTADAFIRNPIIYVDEQTESVGNLTDCTVVIENASQDKITVNIKLDDYSESITCDVSGNYIEAGGNEFYIKSNAEKVSLCNYLKDFPLFFKATDDTMITGDEILEGNVCDINFDANIVEAIDWKGKYSTNVSIEVNDPVHHPVGKSIQTSLKEILLSDSTLKYIIYDHGRGEMADYITCHTVGNEIYITLYHVKKKHGNYNNDVNDIYEVVGQAIKSVTWLKNKASLLAKMISRRKSNHCKFIKGEYVEFSKELKNAKYIMRGRIAVVQPAISKSISMPDKFKEVLGAAKRHIESSGKVNEFFILGSP